MSTRINTIVEEDSIDFDVVVNNFLEKNDVISKTFNSFYLDEGGGSGRTVYIATLEYKCA